MTDKVVAYITRGDKLLVFSHPLYPEAGIQVPAGTIKKGESPDKAVIREDREETELHELETCSFLGVRKHDLSQCGTAVVLQRYFFHLVANQS